MLRKIAIIILLISLILIPGCWDKREPEDLAVVTAVGYDYLPKEGKYKMFIQYSNPLKTAGGGGSGGGGGSDKPAFWTNSAQGHTIEDCVANLRKKTSRGIHYAHLQISLISQRFLKNKGLMPFIYDIRRSRQSRPLILIAAVDNVEKAMSLTFPLESANAEGITNQIKQIKEDNSVVTIDELSIFLNKFTQPGIDPVLTTIETTSKAKPMESQPDSPPPILVSGIDVFHKGKYVGSLDDREARGFNWINDKVENSIIIIKHPGTEKGLVSLTANKNESQIIPIYHNGKPAIKLTVSVDGQLMDSTETNKISWESSESYSLNQRLAQVITNDIRTSLNKAQSLQTDIFGFGNAFYRTDYDLWKEMEGSWRQIFSTLPVDIEVKAVVRRMGMINENLVPR